MQICQLLDQLRQLIVEGDVNVAHEQALGATNREPERAVSVLLLSLCPRNERTESPDPALITGLNALRRQFAPLSPQNRWLANSVSLTLGGIQAAAVDYRRKVAEEPTNSHAWRLLGLCDLSRAMNDDGTDPARLEEWWHRAIAELLPPLFNDRQWSAWCLERCQAYRLSPDGEHFALARERVLGHLHQLLSQQKIDFEETSDRSAAIAVLDRLSVELHGEEMRYQLLSEIAADGEARRSDGSIPFPFGLVWYRRENAPAAAQKTLSDVLAAASSQNSIRGKAAGELRQWFSRLAHVKHALRWGQLSVAEEALQQICSADQDCRPGAGSIAGRTIASPVCCDSRCSRFAYCNPGYLGVDQPDAALELDAHRLALEVALGRAHQCLTDGRHRLLEAAQYWKNAALLAETLGRAEEETDRIADDALSFIDSPSVSSDYGIEILTEVLRAVPTPRIKGRLADRLLNMGIVRCNESEWPIAATFLRRALQLNPRLERAIEPLLAALCHQTLTALQTGHADHAQELLSEVVLWRAKAEQKSISLDGLAPLLSLAEDACHLLAEREAAGS